LTSASCKIARFGPRHFTRDLSLLGACKSVACRGLPRQGENTSGSIFEGVEGGFVFGFHEQINGQYRRRARAELHAEKSLRHAQKVSEIAGCSAQCDAEESDSERPNEPVEGFAQDSPRWASEARRESRCRLRRLRSRVSGGHGNAGTTPRFLQRRRRRTFGGSRRPQNSALVSRRTAAVWATISGLSVPSWRVQPDFRWRSAIGRSTLQIREATRPGRRELAAE